jgi:hypothetical protein
MEGPFRALFSWYAHTQVSLAVPGQGGDAGLVLVGVAVFPEFDLGDGLVGEGGAQDECWGTAGRFL